MLTRRQFLQMMVATPVLAGLYAWQVEPAWVEYVRLPLPVRNLPDRWVGRTLVQLSDLHIGPRVDPQYLRRTFAAVSALRPDLVAYTGDFVTYAGPSTLGQLSHPVGEFPRGALGTVAVLGNHDFGEQWRDQALADNVAAQLADHGCVVLRNQCVEVGGLVIGGVDDFWSGKFHLGPVVSARPAVVLCHNPDACDLPGWRDFQGWVLSGHTHGGQCRPPFLPPPLLPVKNPRYTAGTIALGEHRTLYINRGLGHLLKVRFNARPEVTIFTLEKARA